METQSPVETQPRPDVAPMRRDGADVAPRPSFATPVSTPAPARRLLLLTYHFPPSGLVGGLRWQKMARHAVERGWGVDVFCLHPDDVQVRDDSRLADLPNDVRVYGVRQRELPVQGLVRAAARLRRRLKGLPTANVGTNPLTAAASDASPAARTGPESLSRDEVFAGPWSARRATLAMLNVAALRVWPHDAARLAARVLGPEHRAIVTSGPPHMVHLAGETLARTSGLAHVVDMRDPWSLNERTPEPVASRLWYRLNALLERRVLRRATLVTCNTEHAARALRSLHPDVGDRIVTVMNGTDDEPMPRVERGIRFVVAYAGQVYMDRSPRALFAAAARLARELRLSPADFGVEFMGGASTVEGRTIDDLARDTGIAPYFQMHAGRPRAEALRFLAGASVLVSLPQDSHMAIPSKVFEYALFDAWLLVLAPAESATGLVLAGTSADVVSPDDEDGIHAVLHKHYLEHAAGVRPVPVGADGRFSRRRQAALLLDRLDAIVGGHVP